MGIRYNMKVKSALFTSALIFIYCSLASATPAFHYDHATLVRVVDGDTIRVDVEIEAGLVRKNVSCRLLRIDAPEMSTASGPIVKAALANFLYGKTLRIDYDKPDSFGRWLIELWADGQNVSDWLLKGDFATSF